MRVRRLQAAIAASVLALALSGAALAAASPAGAVTTRTDGTAPTSAISSMWAWGNPIDPAVDARGLGMPQFEPQALAAFAAAHHLRTVYLSVPWAADEGPFSAWLTDAVSALHGAGVTTVAALGG